MLQNLFAHTKDEEEMSIEHSPKVLFLRFFAITIKRGNICLFKVNYRNTRRRCKICSKLPHDVVLVSLLLTLNIIHTLFYYSLVNFEQLIVSCNFIYIILLLISINPSRPNLGRREKIKLNFYFHTLLWCLKRF